MSSDIKTNFLNKAEERLGKLSRFGNSLSLFKSEGNIRLYIRYSKTHVGNLAWYGLREIDIRQLQGYPSLLCFLWDNQVEPLLIPFSEFEDVFQSIGPADDGQYKAQVYLHKDTTEFYIARGGRFNVEGFLGWGQLENLIKLTKVNQRVTLNHSQVQTLLGSIGTKKNYDIWIPTSDRQKLDWSLTKQFTCRESIPNGYEKAESVLQEIDVIWLSRGSNNLTALFEIEHSTPIYSGLLRLNDIHLIAPSIKPKFSVVSNEQRRSLFIKQLQRPTFQTSGLNDLCTFLEYYDVFNWHQRVNKEA